MNKVLRGIVFQFFLYTYSTPALSRYTDHLQGDGYGGGDGLLLLILAALFLASTAKDYVKKAFEKSKTDGMLALLVISGIAIAIFNFPIIGSFLLLYVILLFIWEVCIK